jgi:uncharacterized protein (TIGR03086 family)
MSTDPLNLYKQASDWTTDKVAGVSDLDGSTPCDDWKMRDLLNHMLATQDFFLGSARGEQAAPPGPNPPELLSDDPHRDFQNKSAEVVDTFSQDGVIEKTGPSIGIAFADMLLHGWDVAKATGQDTQMPEGLAQAAYDTIHGRFTDEQRKGVFKPEVPVGADVTPQQRLLAYTGRDPS